MIAPALDRQELEKRVVDALYSQAPEEAEGLSVMPFGEAGETSVRYYLYRDVLGELVKAAHYRRQVAVAILMGRFCMDQDGPFIEVSAFRDLEYLYDDDEDLVKRLLPMLGDAHQEASEDGDRHLVGVFLSRPGGGAALDEETARMHLSLFNMPFQVALIIDGVENYLALYRRAPGQPFVNTPFFLVGAAEEAATEQQAQKMEPDRDRDSEQELDESIEDDDEHKLEQMSYDD